MSSKSKKQQKKKPERSRRAAGPGGVAAEPAPPREEKHRLELPDEVLHAPEATSKLRFALMIGLVIVLLIIFIVPSAIMNIFRRGGTSDRLEMSWIRPGHGREELTANEFVMQKRAFEDAIAVDPLLAFQFGLPQRGLDAKDVARLIVLDRLAEDAGVRIDSADLADHLQMLLNFPLYNRSAEAYKQVAARYGSIEYVESTISRCLRGQRYLQIAGFAGALPDPQEIEKAWHADHVELSFEYAELPVADLDEAARAELPSDADLEVWLSEQPETTTKSLELPERRAAQVARYVDPVKTPAAGLLEAFPPPPDTDPEERAHQYYDKIFHLRFVKPSPAEDGKEGESAKVQDPSLKEFYTFDEVRERCLAEAPIYFAMQDFLADLQARQNAGEEVDLPAEAQAKGLEVTSIDTPLTRAELAEHPELGDSALVNEVFFTPPGSFAFRVVPTPDELAIVRVTERVAPSLPPFAEIRDEVADLWVEPRRADLAKERLEDVWKGFEVFTPEADDSSVAPLPADQVHRRASGEEFLAAVEAAGLQVQTSAWKDKAKFDFEDELRSFTELEEGEVGEPITSQDGERVILARLAGTRDVPVEQMSPKDYERYKTIARGEVAFSVASGFDLPFLEKQYELYLFEPKPVEEEPAGEGAPGK